MELGVDVGYPWAPWIEVGVDVLWPGGPWLEGGVDVDEGWT